jgi:hypothetical protein
MILNTNEIAATTVTLGSSGIVQLIDSFIPDSVPCNKVIITASVAVNGSATNTAPVWACISETTPATVEEISDIGQIINTTQTSPVCILYAEDVNLVWLGGTPGDAVTVHILI